MLEFKLPEIGENIKSGNVVSVLVKVGDAVKKDQSLIELETDKASIEIPSPANGVIKELLVKAGDVAKIGQIICKIATEAPAGAESSPKGNETASASTSAQPVKTPEAPKQQTQAAQPVQTQAPTAPQMQAAPTPVAEIPAAKSVVVIGGGPGGYAAAFYAADLGLETTLIDLEINPGGVCLYRGCIPSKALLHSAKILSEAKAAKNIGLDFGSPKIDLEKLRGWKNKVVQQLTGGLGQIVKLRKVKFIQGRAVFIDSNTLEITKADGSKQNFPFEKAILATGSHPIKLPFAPASPKVLDSTTALDLPDVPQKLLVVGGGYIGLELGTVYAELGSKVDVVEMTPGLLPGADRDLAMVLEKRAEELFATIMLNTKVTKMEETPEGVKVSFEDKDGKASSVEYNRVLVSIGRKPNSPNLGLEKTKVQLDAKGFVKIKPNRGTDDASIYAIGDIAGEPMLAHKASHEARVAVEAILGKKSVFEPQAIPAVVFTDPEIAWCGLTESQAKAEGRDVKIAKFPWAASGRSLTLDRSDGVTKLIIDPTTERILGVAIAGPGAGELIAEGVLALEMGCVVSDLALSIHPHPTLSETIMESAESFFGHATHVYRPKK